MTFTKYAEAHNNPKGEGDARPTALQIISDEDRTNALPNKVFLITGVSSGIGIETFRAIASTGATVFGTVRSLSKGQEALSDVLEPGRAELIHMDLDSLDSVREGAKEFLQKGKGKCNVLICNAGVMAIEKRTLTKDGFEAQFGTNHLAHFLLFNLVKDALLKSSTEEFNSRVVVVSSSGHRVGGIRFGNTNFDQPGQEEYNQWAAYAQSKSANVYMANEIDRKYGAKGLHATSLQPGAIWTGLGVHVPGMVEKFSKDEDAMKIMKNPAQGAATTVWAAVGKEWEGKGGEYLENCQVAPLMTDAQPAWKSFTGATTHTHDPEAEARLWKESLTMVGLKE